MQWENNMPRIVVELPKDRTQAGTLELQDDSGKTVAGPFDVLGKADNQTATSHGNPDRDPAMPYGDTPTGSYDVSGYKATGNEQYSAHSYGTSGAIALDPVGGDAAEASDNGRTGLMIHAGDLGAEDQLRPTNGCMRMSNEDMATLMSAISSLE